MKDHSDLGSPDVLAAIVALLDGAGVPYDLLEHAPVSSSEAAAALRGTPLAIGGKSLLLKADDTFHVVDFSAATKMKSRLFRRHVGIAPKAVIRRVRLREVAARVEDGLAPNLADLAAELGYADQAHLARDFRSATGRTLRGFEAAVHET